MAFTSYDAAVHALDRARGLLAGAQRTAPIVLRNPTTGKRRVIRSARLPASTRGDMRRLSLVMAVAALDTYMHRLIVERVYTHERLPKGLARLTVSFANLLESADNAAAAARKEPHNPKPRVKVKRQLRDRLLRETFQNYESVTRALTLAGRSKEWEAIGAEMSPPQSPATIQSRLNEVVVRRNQIVHEGDYRRLERPRDSKRNGMSHRQAERDIEFIAQIVDAIHAVVS